MKNKREEGYYFVKEITNSKGDEVTCIARYDGYEWTMSGRDRLYNDDYFSWISPCCIQMNDVEIKTNDTLTPQEFFQKKGYYNGSDNFCPMPQHVLEYAQYYKSKKTNTPVSKTQKNEQ